MENLHKTAKSILWENVSSHMIAYTVSYKKHNDTKKCTSNLINGCAKNFLIFSHNFWRKHPNSGFIFNGSTQIPNDYGG